MASWLLTALLAAQVHAVPPAAIECAAARVPPADAEAIGLAMREGGLPSEALMERAADAVVACTPEDAVLRRGVFQGVMSDLMRASLRRYLAAQRIDMEGVDRRFDTLPIEVRTNHSVMEARAQGFVEGLLEGGADPQALLANGRALGLYLGARVGVVRAGLGLPAGAD